VKLVKKAVKKNKKALPIIFVPIVSLNSMLQIIKLNKIFAIIQQLTHSFFISLPIKENKNYIDK